jgi:GNAT superfamily N-acetyltransferase
LTGAGAGAEGVGAEGVGADVSVREATRADVPLIHAMIVALAVYEREPDAVTGDEQSLARWLFGDDPAAEAVIAEVDDEPAGLALYYRTFSTWECEPGLWLEDLFVYERHRRAGVGLALLRHLAAVAVRRGCTRLEWAALDWNDPALRFYEGIGATVLTEWKMLRLDGAGLGRLAGGA